MHGYILCFSIASRQSYDMIQQINDALLSTLGNAPDVPRILVGTNGDKAEMRQLSFEVRGWVWHQGDVVVLRCLMLATGRGTARGHLADSVH